jgi:hypothetical protein
MNSPPNTYVLRASFLFVLRCGSLEQGPIYGLSEIIEGVLVPEEEKQTPGPPTTSF